MTCMYCQGLMARGTAPFHADRYGYHLLIDAVPAWVCAQCGEPFFEEREVKGIQRLLLGLDKQALRLASAA